MKLRVTTLAICAAIFLVVVTFKHQSIHPAAREEDQEPPRASAEQGAKEVDNAAIDAVVRDALKAWQAPGVAVGVVQRGQVIYLKGVGLKELGKDKPVTPDTLFPIGSCTKMFTTT